MSSYTDTARENLATLGITLERYEWIRPEWEVPKLPPNMAQRFPFYQLVPKDFDANVEFRQLVLQMGQRDEAARRDLWTMCRRDRLFWINTFLFIEEPRAEDAELVKLPWITFPAQDAMLVAMMDAWGRYPLAVEKSRAQAASWSLCALMMGDMQFSINAKMLLCSDTGDLVDKIDEDSTLFAKLRFMDRCQPYYLKPGDMNDKLLNLSSRSRSNNIAGARTTEDTGRSKRCRVVGVDEAASIQQDRALDKALSTVTECRIDLSTPKGATGSFYDRVKRGSKVKKITMHWAFNPLCNEGLRFDAGSGKLSGIPNFADGKPWSPWYEKRCEEVNYNKVVIAQELDLSYTASNYQFFDEDQLRKVEQKNKAAPTRRGYVVTEVKRNRDGEAIDVVPIEWVDSPDGPIELWLQMTAEGKPIADTYGLGADIGMGTGASNSVCVAKSKTTGRKVMRYRTNKLVPSRFAEECIALGKWLGGPGGEAKLGWERNGGPGRHFGDTVQRLGYGHILWEKDETKIGKPMKDKPGWWSSRESKGPALHAYADALFGGQFIEPSESAYEEHRLILVGDRGKIFHAEAEASEDPTDSDDNHADEVIANMVCELTCKELDPDVDEEQKRRRRSFSSRWDDYDKTLDEKVDEMVEHY